MRPNAAAESYPSLLQGTVQTAGHWKQVTSTRGAQNLPGTSCAGRELSGAVARAWAWTSPLTPPRAKSHPHVTQDGCVLLQHDAEQGAWAGTWLSWGSWRPVSSGDFRAGTWLPRPQGMVRAHTRHQSPAAWCISSIT